MGLFCVKKEESKMDPLFLGLSCYRRRKHKEAAAICTEILEKNPYDQSAWLLKCQSLVAQVYVDEIEVEEEGIAEALMDDNAIAQVPRPGTSLKSAHLADSSMKSIRSILILSFSNSTNCEFFWGILEACVYKVKIRDTELLKQCIRNICKTIDKNQELLCSVQM
ncbi:unnamed protein product [Darwinula stevensoni]|uniref:Uncharacterized protein n=1 Tax=Darwinula stevensoni TaxID=69355 RepID=A0A7R9ABY1_9CRUS|nr:unnamed protein product [Darwinula stevensoni]CAG0899354.1 unnamed protein product [Darwinula stevensoni]